ncbi:fatty-acid--CoA ligase [Rhodococcus sp. 06-462-5]|uniref:class I adenylate-forming enzyme family protein n=1 Tax=Nocardiaceae TaxID=85025 RepID=UPI00050C8395|nr:MULTISPECIES: AMP-binding protein [Rhodococcus]OZC73986.1 fatty-acid--CoA ligase [Rhodococcus sp. 06-462-5]OZE67982.1 fatty-acid--CoA ligase [Rhodococcus sp. 02-925g]OZF51997.1 fatty-acid--CoA ligase [Rhodococcus sp. 14-1411-2a]
MSQSSYSPASILPTAAAQYGTKCALITDTRSLSYTGLNDLSDRVAAALVDRGVEPGQLVSLFSQNRWEWVVAYHGILKAGAVVNPINVMLTYDELAFVLDDCEAVAVFTSSDHAGRVVDVANTMPRLRDVICFDGNIAGSTDFTDMTSFVGSAPEVDIDAAGPGSVGYTSGTTGHPKGAVQSHRAVLLNCALTATMHGRTDSDVVVTALPTPHVYGNVVVNGTFIAGGTVVLMQRFDATRALELIEHHRATMFEGVPAMYSMMLAEDTMADRDISSLTRCTVGGQTMATSTIERWQTRAGAPLLELWGMTEIAGLGATHTVHAPASPGSIGVSIPGTELKVVDLTDPSVEAALGEPGELMVRGPIVMIGYYGNQTATDEVLEADGWLHTGDIATKDDTGHYFVVDRRKDMIITGGYNIYPAEIERVMAAHPDVALVAVGSVPDEVKGELACAYVVRTARSQVTGEELITFAAERLAAYKRPRLVRFVDSLPTTSSGKIMRRRLHEHASP